MPSALTQIREVIIGGFKEGQTWTISTNNPTQTQTRVKWKSVYYPIGEWVDEFGKKVVITDNFRFTYNNTPHICIFVEVESGGGHGESSVAGKVPKYFREDNLQQSYNPSDIFVDVLLRQI